MQLRPIDDHRHDDAIALLHEGFPARSAEFWRRVLGRAAAFREKENLWPLGYVMAVKGADAGVILTTASSRERPDGTRCEMVNLSGWYVRPSHRLLAAKMLKTVTSRDADIFTDVTPIPSVQTLNEMMGFRLENEAARLYPMPVSALRPAGGATALPADAVPPGAIGPQGSRIMADHAQLGCVTAALRTGEGRHCALVFCRIDRRGVPGLRLVYGPDKPTIARSAGAISRFLARRPILFWELNASRADVLPSSLFWKRAAPCQIKGERVGEGIDYAYSETVFSQA